VNRAAGKEHLITEYVDISGCLYVVICYLRFRGVISLDVFRPLWSR